MGIYLDNAATSFPKPEAVYRAVDWCMREVGASAGRGAYRMAREAGEILQSTRRSLARLFNVGDPSRIAFTANVTESINLAIKGILKRGDHVVTTGMEHNAVWRCLRVLEESGVISLSASPCAADGTLDPGDLTALAGKHTRLIVLAHASNVTGTLMPVREVARFARERGIPVLVDAAQTAGAFPVDVEDLGVDLLAFTGHKALLGPQGTGGLFVREGLELMPLKEGGTGSESLLERQPDTMPDRFEAGTLNLPGIAGLGAGVDYILERTIARIREHERDLTRYALQALERVPGVTIYGPKNPDRQVGVISLNLPEIRPHEVAAILDEAYSIMVRAGLHCAPMAHRTIGTGGYGSIRVGLGLFNTTSDVDQLAGALQEIALKS